MRITAIGDLHGTLDSLLAIMGGLEYIDAKLNWTEKDIQILFTGDCCDRGYNSADIYRLLMQWQKQAPRLGSAIHFIVGNHEVINMYGFDTYNTPEEHASFAPDGGSGEPEFRAAFSQGGWVYNWVIEQHAVIKLGPYIFGHGDLPVSQSDWKFDDIDSRIMDALRISPKRIFFARSLPEVLFDMEDCILWCRQAEYDYKPDYADKLESFLSLNDAELYICGHTPSRTGTFRLLHRGRYLGIDTAMVFKQRGMGVVSALKIDDDALTACYFTRRGIEEVPIDRKKIQI